MRAILVLASAACQPQTEAKPVERPTAVPDTSGPAAQPAVVSPPSPAGARVAVTGVLVKRADHVEVCPGLRVDACAGIRVAGAVEDAWLSERGKISVWRLTGRYDGTTLALEGPAQPTQLTAEPEYRNTCPEYQSPTSGVNPTPRLSAAVAKLVREQGDRAAGEWWDRERQTMVIAVKGDDAELRKRVAKSAPGLRICVQGGARYTQTELERARATADRILGEHGVVWSGSGSDVTRNRIRYDAEVIDAATLEELKRETGEAVEVVAFVELLDRSLQELPVAAQRGDVVLLTEKTRSGARMEALGQFDVHYDTDQRCVYLKSADGERVLPVWPFGFWATSAPLKIYDYDDRVVAEEGQTLRLGGGQADAASVKGNACGAKTAWIGYPQPQHR